MAEVADGRGSDGGRQALTLAAFLVAYLAVVHCPKPLVGMVRLSILLSMPVGSRGPGIVDIAAGYIYIGLPALALLSALIAGPGRRRASRALAAIILAGIAIPIALLDLLVAPMLAGPGA